MARTKTATAEAIIIDQPTAHQVPAVSNNYNTARQVDVIMEKALNSTRLDVKKMQAIMDMQLQYQRFQAEIAYNIAMSECQSVLPHIEPNQTNKHTNSKYADLDAIDEVIRPIYTRFGFSLSFDTHTLENTHKEIICWVRHREGHKERHTLSGELDNGGFKGTANKTGIQAAGSTVSYLQRYLTKLIFNVVIKGEDKDGNKTGNNKPKVDEFTQKLNEIDKNKEQKPIIVDDNKDWDMTIKYGSADYIPKSKFEDNEEIFIKEAVSMLIEFMGKHTTKATRLKIIAMNIPFIKFLGARKMDDVIQTFHKFADEGK